MWLVALLAAVTTACFATFFSQYTHLGSLIRSWTSFLAPIETTSEVVIIVEGHGGDRVRPTREIYAKLLSHLEATGAGAVAFDVYFEPVDRPSETLIKETRHLESALQKAKIPVGLIFAHEPSELAEVGGLVTGPLYDPGLFENVDYPASVVPLAGVGVTLEGGPVGALAVGVQDPDRGFVPGLAVWAFSQISGKPAWTSVKEGHLDLKSERIAVFEGEVPLYFPVESRLKVMGIGEALEAKGSFKDKIVIVGTASDLHQTALGELPGAVVNGFGVNWLVQQQDKGAFIILGPFWAVAFASILAVGAAFACLTFRYPGNLTICALHFALPFVSPSLLASFRVVGIDWLAPLLAMTLTVMITLGLRSRSSLPPSREGTFSATCLFLDLKGSLSIGERLGSHDSAEVKRRVLNALGAIVRQHHGVVETSLGDGLYCVFTSNSPVKACEDALAAAIESVRLDERLIQQTKEDFGVAPEVRATIESGRLTSSTLQLGAERPSTSGRPADFASRLQPIAKQLGKNLLMGPESYALLSTVAEWDTRLSKIADVPIEGSAEKVSVYSLTQEG